MSSQHVGFTQDDWQEWSIQSKRQRALEGGARYGRGGGQAVRANSGPSNECLGCGAGLHPDVGRVVGDENGCTPVCGECSENRSTTTQAVVEHHGGNLL